MAQYYRQMTELSMGLYSSQIKSKVFTTKALGLLIVQIFTSNMNLRNTIQKIIVEAQQKEKQPSPLNEAFWSWFGNSKVVGNDGNPLVCYHGTFDNFDTFDIKKVGHGSGNYGHYGYGIYFSDSIAEAKRYGSNIFECYLKIENPFTGTDDELRLLKKNGIESVDDEIILSLDFDSLQKEFEKIDKPIGIFLQLVKKYGHEGWEKFAETGLKSKLDMNDVYDIISYSTLYKDVHGVPDNIFDTMRELGLSVYNIKFNTGFEYNQAFHWITKLGEISREVTEVIKKLGYDGVIYGSEHVLFKPTQIKSIYNEGLWASNNPNIYK
jgi:hypothetical protein